MGMFDWFRFACPRCGHIIEEQSKAGPCLLKNYTIGDVHPTVAGALAGTKGICVECNFAYQITVQQIVSIQPHVKGWDNEEVD